MAILLLGGIILSGGSVPAAAVIDGGTSDRSHIVYAVAAHPDDEGSAWHSIERRPSDYTVFILMTQGEHTDSCVTAEEAVELGDPGHGNGWFVEGVAQSDATGPFKYQGPASPVGEPDKGERHPLGYPWVGRGTRACAEARVASWHWFLDDMASVDPSLPSFDVGDDPAADDDYRGQLCGVGATCAPVWADADGARIAFDAGDGSLTKEEVVAAITLVRANAGTIGIPDLPEAGMIAAVYASTSEACLGSGHPDHEAVHAALFEVDFDAGYQIGPTCNSDARWLESPGPLLVQDPVTKYAMEWVDPVTERRMGFYHENYGWLYPTYAFDSTAGYAFYWRRFG